MSESESGKNSMPTVTENSSVDESHDPRASTVFEPAKEASVGLKKSEPATESHVSEETTNSTTVPGASNDQETGHESGQNENIQNGDGQKAPTEETSSIPAVSTVEEKADGAPEEATQDARINALLSGSAPKEQIDSFSDDEIQIDESGDATSESGSDDSTSSSESESDASDDSESDDEAGNKGGKEKNRKEDVDELDEEDEAISGPILSKHEIADEKAPSLPADYTVPENAPLEYIGDISGVVEKSVIIKANVSGEFRILKDDSVLCFEDRQLLGPLFETFGRLQAPVYRVKFNTDEEFQKVKDKKGSKVFYVVPESQFIYTDTIKKFKGTDASNCHDEELPEEEQEYSDDEQELAAKQERNRKRKQKKQENGESTQNKKPSSQKPAKSFVSYGFAEQKPVAPPASIMPQLRHHNPALHGTPPQQPVQAVSSTYGVPYSQPANGYGQPNSGHGYLPQYQAQQQYVQQAYGQYGQYPAGYQNPYGQPYSAQAQPHQPYQAYAHQAHQSQQYQQYPQYQQQPYQPPGVQAYPQHPQHPQHYQQQFQQQFPQEGYPVVPGQQYASPVQVAQTQPPQHGTGGVPDPLQQLQQMVSQNIANERGADAP